MTTLQEATNLIQLLPIPPDLQNKILILFLGLGTPSTTQIKKLITQMNNRKIFTDFNIDINNKSLWRFKIFMNFNSILSEYNYTSYEHAELLCDLKIAYLDIINYQNKINYNLQEYKRSLYAMSRGRLLEMVNNMDRFRYGEYGTPTANIIRNIPIKDDDDDADYDLEYDSY